MSDLLYMFLGIGMLFLIIEGPGFLFRLIFRNDIKKNENKDE